MFLLIHELVQRVISAPPRKNIEFRIAFVGFLALFSMEYANRLALAERGLLTILNHTVYSNHYSLDRL
jgi:hypothetical protein